MKKLLLSAIVILGFAAVSFGQQSGSADATASAKIVRALTISKTTDMDFGTVTGGVTAGTTSLAASASAGTAVSAGVALFGTSTRTAALFSVAGEPGQLVNITIPTSHIIYLNGTTSLLTTEQMLVDGFVSTPTTSAGSGSANIASDGTLPIYVGATLNVGVGQASGQYISNGSGFSVTVNYN